MLFPGGGPPRPPPPPAPRAPPPRPPPPPRAPASRPTPLRWLARRARSLRYDNLMLFRAASPLRLPYSVARGHPLRGPLRSSGSPAALARLLATISCSFEEPRPSDFPAASLAGTRFAAHSAPLARSPRSL